MPMRHPRPERAAELRLRVAEQHDARACRSEPRSDPVAHVVMHAENTHDRCRLYRHAASLVVEADISAGHRRAESQAAVRKTAYGLGELPHDRWVLRRAEVEAVRYCQRPGPSH